MKHRSLVFILISVLLVQFQVYSQATFRDSIRLAEVVVTGSKTAVSGKSVPVSVTQVSRRDIENSGQLNILNTLSDYVPGYFVTERNILGFGVSTGGSGAISMRGISSQPNTGVLLLIDGQPQYQGIFGHPLADAYVASDIEKVEVVRGPASVLYGSNAMAGVVNLITRSQKTEGLNLAAGLSYGSYNTQKYYATAGYKKDKWSVFVTGNHDKTDGTRANTDFKISNGYLKSTYEINKNLSITADGNLAYYIANDNGSVYAPTPFHIDITRGKTSLALDNRFDHADGALKMYYNFGNHVLSDGFRSHDYNGGLMLYETFRLPTKTALTIGADLKQYGGKANRGLNADTLLHVNEGAVYVYVQQPLGNKFSISGGFRGEYHSLYGFEAVPMGGLTYRHNDNTTFKTSVSKGFRNPTVMELYLYAPNQNLHAERMMNYELSWLQNMLNNKLQFEVTGFYVDGSNLIQVVGSGPGAQRQNTGTFRNKGIEFSGKYQLSPDLLLHASYSYTDMEKNVLAAPRQLASLGVNYRYKIWMGQVSVRQVDQLYSRLMPTPIMQSYTLVNARVAVQPIKNVQFYAEGNNLLDSRYEINYGYPMPGVNWSVGARFNY